MKIRIAWTLVALVLLAACGAPAPVESWPEPDWVRAAPESVGFDSDALADLVDELTAQQIGLHSVTVVRRGFVVLEANFFPWDGTRRHDIASCTKSLTGTAVGVALAKAKLTSLDAPLVSFFPEHPVDEAKQAIRVRDALAMRTGLACTSSPFEATLLEMQASNDYVGFALDLPLATEPAGAFGYCGPVSHLLSGLVSSATSQPLDAWLRDELFTRVGMGEFDAPHDQQGVAHGWGDWRMHPLDLARIGLLYEHGGRWREEQLLPATWVIEATRSHGDGYGYHWWVDDGAFSARGRGGQFLYVNPGLDLVVVTTGSAGPEGEARLAELLADRLLPALRDSEELPANAQAEARLRASVEAAARAPASTTPPAVPAPLATIAAHTFPIGENLLGWKSLTIDFAGDTGTLELVSRGQSSTLTFGLDGVARVSTGRHFSTRPEVELALRAAFPDDHTIALEFDTLGDIDAGTVTLTLDGDRLAVDVFERTFLHGHLVF